MSMLQKGFTLIELLIAIAIVAILSAVAVSNYTKYKQHTAVTVVENRLVQCIRELTTSYADNSSVTSLNCNINNENSVTLTLNTSSGTVNKTINNITIKNYKINCKITNNAVICELAS